jgi:hypothetical protein
MVSMEINLAHIQREVGAIKKLWSADEKKLWHTVYS